MIAKTRTKMEAMNPEMMHPSRVRRQFGSHVSKRLKEVLP